MSPAYVIFSSKPDLCVQFYTHVLGLKNKKKRGVKKKKTSKTRQSQAGTTSTAASTDVSVPFLINREYIMALSSIDAAPKDIVIEAATTDCSAPRELYFVVKESLDDVFQRLKKGAFAESNRILHLEGVSNALRILHLYDPDGNKLRLVELA